MSEATVCQRLRGLSIALEDNLADVDNLLASSGMEWSAAAAAEADTQLPPAPAVVVEMKVEPTEPYTPSRSWRVDVERGMSFDYFNSALEPDGGGNPLASVATRCDSPHSAATDGDDDHEPEKLCLPGDKRVIGSELTDPRAKRQRSDSISRSLAIILSASDSDESDLTDDLDETLDESVLKVFAIEDDPAEVVASAESISFESLHLLAVKAELMEDTAPTAAVSPAHADSQQQQHQQAAPFPSTRGSKAISKALELQKQKQAQAQHDNLRTSGAVAAMSARLQAANPGVNGAASTAAPMTRAAVQMSLGVLQPGSDGQIRVGAYTLAERAIKIAKFMEKRERRIWRKKIKYDCRKKLADQRPRIKGRFVTSRGDAPCTMASIEAAEEAARDGVEYDESEVPTCSRAGCYSRCSAGRHTCSRHGSSRNSSSKSGDRRKRSAHYYSDEEDLGSEDDFPPQIKIYSGPSAFTAEPPLPEGEVRMGRGGRSAARRASGIC